MRNKNVLERKMNRIFDNWPFSGLSNCFNSAILLDILYKNKLFKFILHNRNKVETLIRTNHPEVDFLLGF